MNDDHTTTHRSFAAWGLVIGPVTFVSAWAVGGLRMPDYSPVHDAISRLAAVGSPEQALMNTGFVVYGVAVMVGGLAVRSSIISRAWPAVVVNGLATLAVAALRLDVSATGDQAHGVAATVGYVSLALVPALAAGPLARTGRRRAAVVSVVASIAIGICLAMTVVADANGAFQRAGLGIGDAWLIAAGLSLVAAHQVPYELLDCAMATMRGVSRLLRAASEELFPLDDDLKESIAKMFASSNKPTPEKVDETGECRG